MKEYAIREEASGHAHRHTTEPFEVPRLQADVDHLNARLVLLGQEAEAVRAELESGNYTIDTQPLRSWEEGDWQGDPPGKDKHYVVVVREITPWEPVE
jgi:hypothetical protein